MRCHSYSRPAQTRGAVGRHSDTPLPKTVTIHIGRAHTQPNSKKGVGDGRQPYNNFGGFAASADPEREVGPW